MRALRMLVLSVVTIVATLQAAQATTKYAYVANNSANTVSVVNIGTNTVTATIPVGSFPYAVAVNQAGTFRLSPTRWWQPSQWVPTFRLQ